MSVYQWFVGMVRRVFVPGAMLTSAAMAGAAEPSREECPETTRVTAAKPVMMAPADMRAGQFVYTLDNDAAHNGVAVYRRQENGSLMMVSGSPFQTGGKGLSGGDIDEQGAIRIAGKFVLAVNPGSDSIAVFQKSGNGLLHVEGSPFASNGSTPLSIAVHGDLVYVANQSADFAKPKFLPNITGFRLTSNGQLQPIPKSTINLPAGAGPAQVEFNPQGTALAITSGFQVDGGKGSKVWTFRVEKDGRLASGAGSPVMPEGATGTVGFSWSQGGDHLFASVFSGSGVVPFAVDPVTAAIKQAGPNVGDDQRAACWSVLSRDGRTLYVGNFVSNSISVYSIMPGGKLELLGSIPRRGATNKDTKDIALSPRGDYLYAVGSGEREISIFKVEANHLLTELPTGQSPIVLTTGQNVTGLLVD